MTELTNTKQWKNKPMLNYINRCHTVSLKCKDRLFEACAVEMFTQGIASDLLYVLQMSKPRTFQESVTKAHDMEVIIANHCDNSFSVIESKNDSPEFKKNAKFSTSLIKSTMTISKAPVQISGGPDPTEK